MIDLEKAAKAAEDMYTDLLFEDGGEVGMDLMAQQEFLHGLAMLEAAHRCFYKANLFQVRAMAEMQTGRGFRC